MECIVSGFLFGGVYALFSGQPLTLLGATGPMLIFDLIIYDFCKCHFALSFDNFPLWTRGLAVRIVAHMSVARVCTCVCAGTSRSTS